MNKINLLLAALFVATPSMAFHGYLVKTKKPLNQRQVSKMNLEKVRSDVFVVSENGLNRFRNEVEVVEIEPNHIIVPFAKPNDLLSDQWGIENNGSGVDANVVEAWETNTGSKEIVVAITDTGLDTLHPDLKDNLWENLEEINGKAGVDDDGNGHIDDFHGWNFAENSNSLKDRKRHGTHVAGIVGARGDNGEGLVGVNWEVSLMGVSFFHQTQQTTVADAIKAIDYAVENGAHIINASWGAKPGEETQEEFDLLKESITRAEKAGVVFVAAAGNSGNDNDKVNLGSIPASFDNKNIISVGAITRFGWVPGFSNFGLNSVDVFAPGSVIKSTLPGGYYGNLNGTSMAAPFVSGALALLLAAEPNLSVAELKDRIIGSCDPNSNLTSSCVCKGHINIGKALSQ